MAKFSIFRKVISFFKRNHPTAFPLAVRRVKYKTHNGMLTRYTKPDRFLIRIDNKISEQHAIEVFLHEYAHALCWNHCDDKHDDAEAHPTAWGAVYADLYRSWEQNFEH